MNTNDGIEVKLTEIPDLHLYVFYKIEEIAHTIEEIQNYLIEGSPLKDIIPRLDAVESELSVALISAQQHYRKVAFDLYEEMAMEGEEE